MPKLVLLFSSAGRRVALINCFRNAARQLGISIDVISIDMDPSWSPASQISDHYFRVDHCTTPEFPDQVLKICRNYHVNMIIPTIDTELLIFAKNKPLFNRIGTEVLISSEEFIQIARDKEKTARILKKNGVPVPQTWNLKDISNIEAPCFPLLLKPINGSCSKNIRIVHNKEEFPKENNPGYILQELCKGREFTVNCFYTQSGRCVACVPHFRKFVRDGEVCFAQTERVQELTKIAHKFSAIFKGIYGAICYQAFLTERGDVKVFEINARFGGGYPICDYAGGTFAKWIIQKLSGTKPDYNDNWEDGIRMMRYDEAIFVKP